MAVPQFLAAEGTRVPLRRHQPLTPATIVCASFIGIATVGPLLAMMGFSPFWHPSQFSSSALLCYSSSTP
ncbi:hypothetical protein AAC387_Pa09g1092 [Persea americana]